MRRETYAKLSALTLVVLMLVAPVVAASFAFTANAQSEPVTITIGALLPLTGDLQSYGQRAAAAVEYAVNEMNQYLKQQNAWFQLKLVIEDTQTKPDVAVQKFSSLAAQGVKFIVGPMTSAEVKKIKDLANQDNVIVISPSSTAISLAIPGDNVFRFCPADNVQSKAIAKALEDAGIKEVVIVYRADTWGQGLMNATKQEAEKLGIKIAGTYSYNPESPNFNTIASNVNDEVAKLLKEYKPREVGVVAIGFAEMAQFFTQATRYPDLKKVPWFGSDGTALLTEITDNAVAAKFAEQVLFLNPIFSPAATDEQKKVSAYVKEKTGSEADAYSLAAHDAVVAIALAILKAGPTNDMNQLVDKVKQLLPEITTSQEFAKFAATGTFKLNAAGDRAIADYDWWLVAPNGTNKYTWVKAGKFLGQQDKNEWYKIPQYNDKTYMQLLQERFGATGATASTSTAAGNTGSTQTQAQATTTTQAKSKAPIAGAIIVIIIIIAAAAYVMSKK